MKRVILIVLVAVTLPILGENPPTTTISFTKEIVPILVESCVACHNEKVKKGKYDMRSYTSIMKGGVKASPIVAGKSSESLFSLMMHGDEEPAMPKDADLLPKTVVAKIDAWIDSGAKFDGPDPNGDIRLLAPSRSDAASRISRPVPVIALAYRPDGKELAVSGYHEISFWNPVDGKFLRRWKTNSERVQALKYLPDGKQLLMVGGTPGKLGEAILWNTTTGNPDKQLFSGTEVLMSADISADGTLIAVGGTDRIFRLFETSSGKELAKAENHADWVLALAISADKKKLLSASRDKSVKTWDIQAKEPQLTFSGHTDGVYAAKFTPDGQMVTSAGIDLRIRTWKPEGEAQQAREVAAHANGIFALAYSTDGKILFSAGGDSLVKAWNTSDGAFLRDYAGQSDWVYSLAVAPDGKTLAGGAWNGNVIIWDVATAKPVAQFTALSPATATAQK